jgi:hypothetical protein
VKCHQESGNIIECSECGANHNNLVGYIVEDAPEHCSMTADCVGELVVVPAKKKDVKRRSSRKKAKTMQ